jgi:hypothetical protein
MLYGSFLYQANLYERGWLSGERIITIPVEFETGYGAMVTVAWTGTAPTGTRISAYVSIDGKLSWREQVNGAARFFLVDTRQAGLKNFDIKLVLESAVLDAVPSVSVLAVTISQIATAYRLAYDVLTDAGLTASEYLIDAELLEFYIPYAWLYKSSHKQALKQVIKFVLGNCYTDRSNRIHVDGPNHVQTTAAVQTITARSYFPGRKLIPFTGQLPTQVEVYGNPLVPTSQSEEVYRLNAQTLQAGEAKTYTCFYTTFYTQNPVYNCSASLELAPAGTIITAQEYFAWGAKITVSTNIDCTFNLAISGYPLKVKGRFNELVYLGNTTTVDTGENRFYGRNLYGSGLYAPTKNLSLSNSVSYTHPTSHLIQTREIARKIAGILLQKFSGLKPRMELPYVGNPALEFDDRIRLKNLRDNGLQDYIIKTHEVKYENHSLKGRMVLNHVTD